MRLSLYLQRPRMAQLHERQSRSAVVLNRAGKLRSPPKIRKLPLPRRRQLGLAQTSGRSVAAFFTLRPPRIGKTRTCGGTANGAPCTFPFTYHGKVYHACTTYDAEKPDLPWCMTDGSKWGNCKCPPGPPIMKGEYRTLAMF